MGKEIDVGNISLKDFLIERNFDDDIVVEIRDDWSYPLMDLRVKTIINKDNHYKKCEVLRYSIDNDKRITAYIGGEIWRNKSMNICAYLDYKVTIKGEYSYRSIESEGDFAKESYDNTHIINGGKLLEIIAKEINQNDICNFNITDNSIIIEHFDAMSGETNDKMFVIEKIKKE